ncbi:MAG: HAD family hydrolase [Bacilli bacterium]
MTFTDKKLVLFDLDHTLLPFYPNMGCAAQAAFSDSPLTDGLVYNDFQTRVRYHEGVLLPLHHSGQLSLTEFRRKRFVHSMADFGRAVSEQEADAYFSLLFGHFLRLIRPDENLLAFLRALRERFFIGIITNGKVVEQREKMRRMGLYDVFREEEIFISEALGIEKPDPRIFYQAVASFGVTPGESVYVGDSWEKDVLGATGAGLDAVWVNGDGVCAPDAMLCAMVVPSVRVLYDWFVELKD